MRFYNSFQNAKGRIGKEKNNSVKSGINEETVVTDQLISSQFNGGSVLSSHIVVVALPVDVDEVVLLVATRLKLVE